MLRMNALSWIPKYMELEIQFNDIVIARTAAGEQPALSRLRRSKESSFISTAISRLLRWRSQ
jgi:hypothetical protein